MILISNIVLEVLEGSTVPATEIYGASKKVYVNIGSGNVFRLRWEPPTLTNDIVDRYTVVIERYDPTLNVYNTVYNKNVGLVNEFYVDSSLLPILPEQYLLSIYVIAYSKLGSVITSNIVAPYVCKGSGTYVNVQPEEYAQSIMKRAVAFANASVSNEAGARIVDAEGNEVLILDSEGNQITVEATNLLTGIDWQLITESYVKASDGTWRATDIKYEVLADENGEIITDENSEPIYVL